MKRMPIKQPGDMDGAANWYWYKNFIWNLNCVSVAVLCNVGYFQVTVLLGLTLCQ